MSLHEAFMCFTKLLEESRINFDRSLVFREANHEKANYSPRFSLLAPIPLAFTFRGVIDAFFRYLDRPK